MAFNVSRVKSGAALGVAGKGKPHLTLLAWVVPYSGDPKGRRDTVLSLGVIHMPPFRPFGVAGRGKAPPKIASIGHSILKET